MACAPEAECSSAPCRHLVAAKVDTDCPFPLGISSCALTSRYSAASWYEPTAEVAKPKPTEAFRCLLVS